MRLSWKIRDELHHSPTHFFSGNHRRYAGACPSGSFATHCLERERKSDSDANAGLWNDCLPRLHQQISGSARWKTCGM